MIGTIDLVLIDGHSSDVSPTEARHRPHRTPYSTAEIHTPNSTVTRNQQHSPLTSFRASIYTKQQLLFHVQLQQRVQTSQVTALKNENSHPNPTHKNPSPNYKMYSPTTQSSISQQFQLRHLYHTNH